MNEFIKEMTKRAASCPCIIGFPEADNVDILKTAEQVVENRIGTPFLIGNEGAITKLAGEHAISTSE